MFGVFGQYAEVAKWTIYLAILTALIALGNQVVNGLIEYGYTKHALEVAAVSVERENQHRKKFLELKRAADNVPPPPTVTETIETIKYVNKIVREVDYKCTDISVYSGVRIESRDCIFSSPDGGRDCGQQ